MNKKAFIEGVELYCKEAGADLGAILKRIAPAATGAVAGAALGGLEGALTYDPEERDSYEDTRGRRALQHAIGGAAIGGIGGELVRNREGVVDTFYDMDASMRAKALEKRFKRQPLNIIDKAYDADARERKDAVKRLIFGGK